MTFAKALCIVLLFCSASFCESQSLKNDSFSENEAINLLPSPPDQEAVLRRRGNGPVYLANRMFPKEQTHYAEDYRGFLLYLLREVWKCEGPYNVFDAAQSLDGNGLYFLFWSVYPDADNVEKQDKIYPLYVGTTGRTFKQRFREHINNGVVHKIQGHQWPTVLDIIKLPLIVAYVMEMPLPVAKFFESVFLYSFDFAMNVEENGKERAGIQLTKTMTVENGYFYFKQGYDHIMSYFNNIDKMVSKEQFEKAMHQMFHYQFK